MRLSKLNSAALVAALSLVFLTGAKPAAADTFNIQYYEVPTGTADFHNGDANIGYSPNYVLPTLGPDGLPVYNPSYSVAGPLGFGNVDAPNSIYLNASNELLYWSPTNPSGGNVTTNGTPTTITLSSTATNLFPPGSGGADSSYETTAILTEPLVVPANTTDTVVFTANADDEAYVYVFPAGDPTFANSLVVDVSGIHTIASGTDISSPSESYGPGTYTIEIFYADRDISQSQLEFSDVITQTVTPTPPSITPEPSTFLLLGTGLLGAAGAFRRRFAR